MPCRTDRGGPHYRELARQRRAGRGPGRARAARSPIGPAPRGRRRADPGRGPHRPGRGRVGAAGGRARPGEPDRGRGHPPGALAGVEPEHRAQGARDLLLRRGRGAPHGRAARRAPGRPGRPAGHRRGHPGHQRSRLPARHGRRRGRPAGDRAAGPVGGDHRAGRLRAAHRPVQLRGVSAARPGPARPPVRRAGRGPPDPGLLRVRPQAGGDAGRAGRLPRRGPGRRGVPGAHQDARGGQARHAGRAGRVGGAGQRGGPAGAQPREQRKGSGRKKASGAVRGEITLVVAGAARASRRPVRDRGDIGIPGDLGAPGGPSGAVLPPLPSR